MNRRSFLLGLGAVVAAPRVVRVFAPPGGWRQDPLSGLLTQFHHDMAYAAGVPERLLFPCSESTLLRDLRRLDPTMRMVMDYNRHALVMRSAAPVAAIKEVLWWRLPVGVAAELNGCAVRNDYGFLKGDLA